MVPVTVQRTPAHFDALDGVRGAAALAVLVAHAALVTSAYRLTPGAQLINRLGVAVALFFVISGFVIYRPFVAAQYGLAPARRLGHYARRRVMRIVPAYWLALTICLLVPGLAGIVGSLPLVHSDNAWMFYAFGQVYSAGTAPGGLGQAWTLCCEAAFYALVPLYVLLGRRMGVGPARLRRELVMLLALGAASTVARVVVCASQPNGGYPFQFTFAATFLWFAAGMALATITCGDRKARATRFVERHPSACYALALGLYVIVALVAGLPAIPDRYSASQLAVEHLAYATIALLIVAPAVLGTARSRVSAALASRPMRALGRISYGFYLWHIVVILVLNRYGGKDLLGAGQPFLSLVLASTAVSVVFGVLSWRLVERPLLERSRRRGRAPLVPASEAAS